MLRRTYAATLPVICEICGKPVQPGDKWQLDHIVPRCQGGAWYAPSNLRVLHAKCNNGPAKRLAGIRPGYIANARPSREW
jgi:5-methylcytosine-specific restriction endonuclease McrA